MQYQVIIDDDLPGLIRQVQLALNQGWALQGGVAMVVAADGKPRFAQAVVK